MSAGVLVTHLNGLSQSDYRLQKQLFTFLLNALSTLDRLGKVSGDGIGQTKIIGRESLLRESPAQVQDAQAAARRPQQGADDRAHRPIGDAG